MDNGHMGAPLNRMTDTYEDITFPKLRLHMVKITYENEVDIILNNEQTTCRTHLEYKYIAESVLDNYEQKNLKTGILL